MTKNLKKTLKKVFAADIHEQLAVADAKLGVSIKEKLNISCVHGAGVAELMRGIREQMSSLVTGIPDTELSAMALGLAHRCSHSSFCFGCSDYFSHLPSLSRYKLKFSPDKVDTMIVQAICKFSTAPLPLLSCTNPFHYSTTG